MFRCRADILPQLSLRNKCVWRAYGGGENGPLGEFAGVSRVGLRKTSKWLRHCRSDNCLLKLLKNKDSNSIKYKVQSAKWYNKAYSTSPINVGLQIQLLFNIFL